MDSFAFWCKKKEAMAEIKLDASIHFNLWTEYDESNKLPFLDVGLKISRIEPTTNLYFYVPFSVKINEIKDLGNVLSKNKEVLNAVFNENFTLQDHPKPKQVTVLEGANPKFNIYSLDIFSNIILQEKYDGTIVEISTADMSINPDFVYYFRFRINSDKLQALIEERQPKNLFLQSAVSSNCFIDFRFNDIRSLNKSLIEHIESSNIKVHIKKIHFLLLTRADIDLATNAPMNERKLEKHIWKDYLLGYEPKETIVANHWKLDADADRKDEISACIIYIKFRVYRCNIRTILVYLVVLSILTISLNILSSRIYDVYFKAPL